MNSNDPAYERIMALVTSSHDQDLMRGDEWFKDLCIENRMAIVKGIGQLRKVDGPVAASIVKLANLGFNVLLQREEERKKANESH